MTCFVRVCLAFWGVCFLFFAFLFGLIGIRIGLLGSLLIEGFSIWSVCVIN